MIALSVQGLSKSFGAIQALFEVSFEIAQGEKVLLCGPNGAGKSTLLSCLVGLSRADSGSIRVEYRDLASKYFAFGFVGQQNFLYSHLTIKENLELSLALYGIEQSSSILMPLITRFELSHFLNRYAGECSPGIKQRTAIVRALLHQPGTLILDEPFSSLDQMGRSQLLSVTEELIAAGTTVLCSTHDGDIIAKHRGRVLVLKSGRLAKDIVGPVATLEELYD